MKNFRNLLLFLLLPLFSHSQKLDYRYTSDTTIYMEASQKKYMVETVYLKFYILNDTSFLDVERGSRILTLYREDFLQRRKDEKYVTDIYYCGTKDSNQRLTLLLTTDFQENLKAVGFYSNTMIILKVR